MRLAVTFLGLLALVAIAGHAAAQDVTYAIPSPSTLPDPHGILPEIPTVSGVPANPAKGPGNGQGAPVVGNPLDNTMRIPGVTNPEIAEFATFGTLGLLGSFAIFMGSRFIRPDEVLANPVRQQIYDYLRTRVGANLKQITDDLNLTTTNAIWHLRKLEDADLVSSKRFNGYKVFYPTEGGVGARDLSLSMTALQNGNAQEVFEFVVAHPGAHQREIARALAVNHGTVRWHLKKLRTAQLLTEARQGKVSTYFPTPMGLEALQGMATRNGQQPLVQIVSSSSS
ncbi:MAG TPA: helix-turn-helix domain-containing protein [Candidatus Thermoplasmatota archaeon]|nr:helix-turn-helix domain-containing protein [Candidatus Thermoplasmatota archaeon]